MKQLILAITILFFRISFANAQDFVFSPIDVMQGLSDNQIRYILQLPDGRMVFKTSGNINIYDGARFRYIHQGIQSIYPLGTYKGHYRIYQSDDARLWIKDDHKLMCVDLRTEKYITNLNLYFKKKGFKRSVDDIFLDARQRLWILAANRLSTIDQRISLQIPATEGELQDLTSEKDSLYLFYNTGKVVCYDLKSKKKLYSAAAYPADQQKVFKSTSLVVKAKDGFYQLRNGSMGGCFFFDIQKRGWKKIMETHYALNTLVVDTNGRVAISSAKGIWIIDGYGREQRYFPTLKKADGGTLNTEVSTIFYDKQGGLWLGTLNQGLFYYHQTRYLFTNIGRQYFSTSLTSDVIVQAFAQDDAGYIYIQSQSGIYQYHPAHKNGIKLKPVDFHAIPGVILDQLNQNHSASSFFGDNQTSKLTDIRGWVWTGTYDGLKVFDPVSRKERIFYARDGLSNNFIKAILQDRFHNIWVTTSYGINKVQIDPRNAQIHFTSFRSDAGTLDGEYTNGAAFESTDGTLYFGGINGFSVLNFNSVKPNKQPLKAILINLFLRGEKIETGNKYDKRIILKESTPYTKSIELSYDQNFVSFEFSALNYQNPTQTYYRYQLEGIDRGWKETSSGQENERLTTAGILEASYTNLPPGNYKLRVMASNNRIWDGPVTEIYLSILPPWWKTNTSYIMFTTLGIFIVLTVISIYVKLTTKKLSQNHREQILLLRIRNLVEQQNILQTEKGSDHVQPRPGIILEEDTNYHNKAEAIFLARAMEQVEKNLEVPNYSVVQLSRDLNMDRTGLYRKLITLLDKSPSLFIRNIRLEKAASLLLDGTFSISEITEKVGFSSASYFSKCFQEVYGCKPSEYAEKAKKST
ncbi:helix-turn-helix domain-containing protein [Pedobacter petrophilus]|uniref:Helix-turn-helix domain-containing protein n=1 Tax=Pedobacter petrophilus TaxID=1908241 RepID=A0A7K0FW23_9SPHI|nr:helix-turn-helix domain-containing protein [Pedobacter petrophilus]MRX75793.1 helix-turn-helix domain-containing protein [Pedobacter petrophilus]